jgi:HEAT repeat protein
MFVKRSLMLAACAAILCAPLADSANAQSNSKEIMERPAAELIELVKDPNATVFEKAKACQRLAVIGTADHVPALAALLADENLNLYGRFALEAIPDPAVDEALREAATRLQGRQLVGVINSIGHRRDAKALAMLTELAGHADRAVASAAAHAIGNLATVEAAAVLTEALGQDSPVKRCWGDSALACAEGLAAAGKQAEAVALYQMVAQAAVPKYMQIGALDGQFRLQQTAAKDLLLAQIRSEDKAHFDLGLSVARWMPGADITAALADELEKLPAERQALLLRALGDRQEAVSLPIVMAATKSSSPTVRNAAIAVLAKLGDAAAVGILLDAAVGDGPAAATAREGLKTMSTEVANAAIYARMADADAKALAVLFELAAARRITMATHKIYESLASTDPDVKLAAVAALGQLISVTDLELLTSRALSGDNTPVTAAAPAAPCVGAVVRPPGSRAQPQVPIALVQRRLRLGRQPVVANGWIQRIGMDRRQRAQLARVAHFGGEQEVRNAAALRAGGVDDIVTPHRVRQRLAFGNGHRAGLFAIDVLARLGGIDRRHRVPAVARGDQHRVDILAGQHVAKIAVHLHAGAVFLLRPLLDALAAGLLRVGNRHELKHRFVHHDAQDVSAAAADSHPRQRNSLAGSNAAVQTQHAARNKRRHGKQGTGLCGGRQKTPPADRRSWLRHEASPFCGEDSFSNLPML